jgi:DNA repair photolyase
MSKLRLAGSNLPATLRQVVDYRKSGLSLNHVVGCPLDCGYCVRHLFSNYDMKKPHLVVTDAEAIQALVGHWAFRAGVTPIQIFNRATDPFLPGVKDHLFSCLEQLDQLGLTNSVLVITRWHIDHHDIERLEKLSNLAITILVTWSGIDDRRIEPVDSSIAENSLSVLRQNVKRTKFILYWRPIIAGLNDTDSHLARALELSFVADATVFTGLFYREEIQAHFASIGVPDIYEKIARRKILPAQVENRILASMKGRPIFRKTSCGVAYAHGVADYNGHYGIREICDICSGTQLGLCAKAHRQPSLTQVEALARVAGIDADTISIDDRRIEVSNSREQQRYFLQHSLNYQVHDRSQPHYFGRHGRAEIGWS